MSKTFEITRTIEIFTDEDYRYEVYTGDTLRIKYAEQNGNDCSISFANKAEMKAVALAMLELSEKE